MTYVPIHAMALKSIQIDIPSQSIASSTTIQLGSISDSSVITVASNIITLPTGRDYFITASLNYSQASGTTCQFSFINVSDGSVFSNQTKAYSAYLVSNTNRDTYTGNLAMIVTNLASNLQIQIKKTIHSGTTTIYKDDASQYIANSAITILYTDP